MSLEDRAKKTINFDQFAYGEPMSSQRAKYRASHRMGLGTNTLLGNRPKGPDVLRAMQALRPGRQPGSSQSQYGVKSPSIRPSKRRRVEDASDLEEDSAVPTDRSSPMDDINSLVLGGSRRIRQPDRDSALSSSVARLSSPDPMDANIPRPEYINPFPTLTSGKPRPNSGYHSPQSSSGSATAGPSRQAVSGVKASTTWFLADPDLAYEEDDASSNSQIDSFSKPKPSRRKIPVALPGASVDSAIAIDETPPDPPDPDMGINAAEIEPRLDLKETKPISLGQRPINGSGQLQFSIVPSRYHPNALNHTNNAAGSRKSPTAPPDGKVAALTFQFESGNDSHPGRPFSIPTGNSYATPIPRPASIRPSIKSRMATRNGPSALPAGPIRNLTTMKPKRIDQGNGPPSGFISSSTPEIRLKRLVVGGKDLIKPDEHFKLKCWNNNLSVEDPNGVVKSGMPPIFTVSLAKVTQVQFLDMNSLKARTAEPLIFVASQSGSFGGGRSKDAFATHAIFVLDRSSSAFLTMYQPLMEKLGKAVSTKPQLIGSFAANAILEQVVSMTSVIASPSDYSAPLQHIICDDDPWTPDPGQVSFVWDKRKLYFGAIDNEERNADIDRPHLFMDSTKAVESMSFFGLDGAGADQKKKEAILKLFLKSKTTRPRGSVVVLIFNRTSPLFKASILEDFRNQFVSCMSKISDQDAKEIIALSKLKTSRAEMTVPAVVRKPMTKPKLRRKRFIASGAENEEQSEADFEEPEFETMGDDNESTSLRRSRRQREPAFIAKPPVDETELLFKYPPIRFTRAEATRLQDEEFLNDTLVELGLKLWVDQLTRDNPEIAEQIWVFNSFFYKKLSNPKEGYESVKKWTGKVDIFSKKYIIVPINENLHWYLAVIYEPWHCLDPVAPAEEFGSTYYARTSPSRRITRHRKSPIPILGDDAIHLSDSDAADQDEVTESLLAPPSDLPPSSSRPPSPTATSGNMGFFEDHAETDRGGVQASQSRGKTVESDTVPTEGLTESASRIWFKADPNNNEQNDDMEVDNTLAGPRAVEIDELADDDDDGMDGQDVHSAQQISPSPSIVSLQPREPDPEALLTPRGSPPDTPAGIDSSLRGMSLDSPKPAKSPPLSAPASKDSDKCRIFVLDSLGSRHPKVMSQLKSWLEKEAADKKAINQIQPAIARNVKVPYQPNHFDCGVYLLHFAEIFVEKTDEIQRLNEARTNGPMDAKVRDAVFEKAKLLKKRKTLREKCQQLAQEWKEANPTVIDDSKTRPRIEALFGIPPERTSKSRTNSLGPSTSALGPDAVPPNDPEAADSGDEIEIVGENPAPISPPKKKRKRGPSLPLLPPDSPLNDSPLRLR